MTPFTIMLFKREPTGDDGRMWVPVLSKTIEEILEYTDQHKGEEMGVTATEFSMLCWFTFCAIHETCPCMGCTYEALFESDGADEEEVSAAFRGLMEKGWLDVGGEVDVSRAN